MTYGVVSLNADRNRQEDRSNPTHVSQSDAENKIEALFVKGWRDTALPLLASREVNRHSRVPLVKSRASPAVPLLLVLVLFYGRFHGRTIFLQNSFLKWPPINIMSKLAQSWADKARRALISQIIIRIFSIGPNVFLGSTRWRQRR